MTQPAHPTARIARVVYETVRAFAVENGDAARKGWDDAPEAQREYFTRFVTGSLAEPRLNAYQLHNRTIEQRIAQGWTLGDAYSAQKRTDPDLVPYGDLSHDKRVRLALMVAVIRELQNYWPL